MPARSSAEIWTKTSAEPSSGWMKPKPLVELNHFTVPLAMGIPPAGVAPHDMWRASNSLGKIVPDPRIGLTKIAQRNSTRHRWGPVSSDKTDICPAQADIGR